MINSSPSACGVGHIPITTPAERLHLPAASHRQPFPRQPFTSSVLAAARLLSSIIISKLRVAFPPYNRTPSSALRRHTWRARDASQWSPVVFGCLRSPDEPPPPRVGAVTDPASHRSPIMQMRLPADPPVGRSVGWSVDEWPGAGDRCGRPGPVDARRETESGPASGEQFRTNCRITERPRGE